MTPDRQTINRSRSPCSTVTTPRLIVTDMISVPDVPAVTARVSHVKTPAVARAKRHFVDRIRRRVAAPVSHTRKVAQSNDQNGWPSAG